MVEIPKKQERYRTAHGIIMAVGRGDGTGFEAQLEPYLDHELRTKNIVHALASFAWALAEIGSKQAGKDVDWFMEQMALDLAGE